MQNLAKFSLASLAILPKIQKVQMRFTRFEKSRWEKEHLFQVCSAEHKNNFGTSKARIVKVVLHSSLGDLCPACQVDAWNRKVYVNEVHEAYLRKNDWKALGRDCFDTTAFGGMESEAKQALAFFFVFYSFILFCFFSFFFCFDWLFPSACL